jgi:hypothetical protein
VVQPNPCTFSPRWLSTKRQQSDRSAAIVEAKPAKAAKVEAANSNPVPTLAILAGAPVQTRNSVVEAEAKRPATPVTAWWAGVARLSPARNLAHPTLQSWATFAEARAPHSGQADGSSHSAIARSCVNGPHLFVVGIDHLPPVEPHPPAAPVSS